MPSPILTVAPSRIKYGLLFLCALGFVLSGLFLILKGKGGDVWIGWMSVAFFGAGIPLFTWQFFDARPRVILDDVGAFDRTLGVGMIPWSEISGAYTKSVSGNWFVCLELRNADRWIDTLSGPQRALVGANVRLGFQPLNINLSGTSARPELVLDIVLKKSAEHSVVDD